MVWVCESPYQMHRISARSPRVPRCGPLAFWRNSDLSSSGTTVRNVKIVNNYLPVGASGIALTDI